MLSHCNSIYLGRLHGGIAAYGGVSPCSIALPSTYCAGSNQHSMPARALPSSYALWRRRRNSNSSNNLISSASSSFTQLHGSLLTPALNKLICLSLTSLGLLINTPSIIALGALRNLAALYHHLQQHHLIISSGTHSDIFSCISSMPCLCITPP